MLGISEPVIFEESSPDDQTNSDELTLSQDMSSVTVTEHDVITPVSSQSSTFSAACKLRFIFYNAIIVGTNVSGQVVDTQT